MGGKNNDKFHANTRKPLSNMVDLNTLRQIWQSISPNMAIDLAIVGANS